MVFLVILILTEFAGVGALLCRLEHPALMEMFQKR